MQLEVVVTRVLRVCTRGKSNRKITPTMTAGYGEMMAQLLARCSAIQLVPRQQPPATTPLFISICTAVDLDSVAFRFALGS